jgi:hypothetical protein
MSLAKKLNGKGTPGKPQGSGMKSTLPTAPKPPSAPKRPKAPSAPRAKAPSVKKLEAVAKVGARRKRPKR